MVLRLEHSILFPDESKASVDNYINGIGRNIVLLAGSYFASFDKTNPAVRDNQKVLSKWFNEENNSFANWVYNRILELKRKGQEPIILNIYSSLKMLEKGFHLQEKQIVTDTEAEKNIFKAYLLLNELDNNKDNGLFDSIKNQPIELKFPLLILTQTYRYADISFVNYAEVFSEQFVKAIFFFEFIESKYPDVLAAFLEYYECATWKHYLKKIFPLVHGCIKNTENTVTEIIVEKDAQFEENIRFINKLSFVDEIDELKDYDFVTLRSKPFFRKSEDTYRVIYDLFVFEKIFNSIFFTLRSIPKLKGFNLKDIFTFQFSEKILLYQILDRIFKHSVIRYSGRELDEKGIVAAPDYYVRNKKQIFIFESKDIVLNAEIKESSSFETYEKEIKKKLYFDDSSGKTKPKAILQLIASVRKVLENNLQFDEINKTIRIYPIIVVHHRQLNVGGLNHLLANWFRDELKRLDGEGLNTKRVSQLTMINISTLIHYSDFLYNKKHSLSRLVEAYHRATSLKAKIKGSSKLHLENILMARIIPFNMFVTKRIKSNKSPLILKEKIRRIIKGD